MRAEQVTPFEPIVNDTHLCDFQSYIGLLMSQIKLFQKKLPGTYSYRPIVKIPVGLLKNTPFYVGCYGYVNSNETFMALRIFHEANPQGKDNYVGIAIKYDPIDSVVYGDYENGSAHISTDLQMKHPICNISGILAPIEDAFSQTMALKHEKSVQRVVFTDQPEKSRFIQNYIKRGYAHSVSDDRQNFILEKEFVV